MMGRRRKHNTHLPARMQYQHGAYYYVHGNRWQRLDADYPRALELYAALHRETGTMPALINRVLLHHRPRVSDNTHRQYETAARILCTALAEFRPEQVRPTDVAQIKTAMADRPNMANRCLSFLRLVFNYAVEWGESPTNPVIGIRRHTEKKRSRYITDEEFAAIYRQAGDRLQVIMTLLYLTGQRVTDVLGLRRSDVTDDGIRFQQGKTGVRLTVAMTPKMRAAVERAKGLRGRVTALTLFSNRNGRAPAYKTVRDQWELACKRAGVEDAHMHDIRAKSLTDAKRQGLDATALAGHASARMTERYIRLRESPVVAGPSPDSRQSSKKTTDSIDNQS